MIIVNFDQVDQGLGVRNSISVETKTKRSSFSRCIDFYHAEKVSEPQVLDGYILAVLFEAMATKSPIRVKGKVSRAAVRNFWAIGEAWRNMNPELYSPVEIEADQVLDFHEFPAVEAHANGMDRAVMTFSGGVDSLFSAIRHSRKNANRELIDLGGVPGKVQSLDISLAIMVHGFDVRFENSRDFSRLMKKTKEALLF